MTSVRGSLSVFHVSISLQPPMAEEWLKLEDELVTADDVQNLLGQITDDHWVAAACVDRVLSDTAVQLALLRLGIARTEKLVDRCKDIIALSSSSHTYGQDEGHGGPLLSHFTNTPADAELCHLRSVLLRRLDRLNTYVDMQAEFNKEDGQEKADEEMEEWEDDPWAEGNDDAGPSSKPALAKSKVPPPISLSEFLQNDLLWSACELASLSAIQALHILLRKHSTALWPARFKILQCIPDYTYPSICRDLFPTLDLATNTEIRPTPDPWRQEPDFVELPETQAALGHFKDSLPIIADSASAGVFVKCESSGPPCPSSCPYV
jgi:neuroblastoma-amplified sequence